MNCLCLALSVVQWSFSPKVKVTATLGAWVELGNVSSARLSKLTSGNFLSNDFGHTTWVCVHYSFRTVVWVLLRPTRTNQWKCCETGPTVFRPYPKKLESLTICRCYYKGSTFFSVIQRPWLFVRPAFEARDLPLSRPALSQQSLPGGCMPPNPL